MLPERGNRRYGRRGWRRDGEAIDRLLADRLVDAVVDVPAQEGGSALHQRLFMKAARIGAHIAESAWLAIWPLFDGSST